MRRDGVRHDGAARARALWARGRREAAVKALAAGLRRAPGDPSLNLAWADLLREAGAHAEAESAYRAAAALPGAAGPASRGLGACLAAQGRWGAARAAFSAALRADTADAEAGLCLAQACLAVRDLRGAARAARPLRLPAPRAESLALAFVKAGRPRDALGLLERAACGPGDAAGARLRGELLLRLGRPGDAAPWLARAAGAGGTDGFAALLLAGRLDEAFAAGRALAAAARRDPESYYHLMNPFRQTLERPAPRGGLAGELAARAAARPGDPWPVMLRLGLLSLAGRTREAAALAPELRRRARGADAWMRYLCGHLVLQTTGRVAEADADFRAALRAAPRLWRAEAYRAELALCRGRAAAALAAMARLEGRLGGLARAEARAWRGQMLVWLGRAAEAEAALSQAHAGGAPFAQGWRGGARVLLGRHAEAAADLSAALARSGPEEEALVWRAQARLFTGDARGARADAEAALRVSPRSDWARLALAALGDARALGEVRPALRRRLGLAGRSGLTRAFGGSGVRRSQAYLDALVFPGEPAAAPAGREEERRAERLFAAGDAPAAARVLRAAAAPSARLVCAVAQALTLGGRRAEARALLAAAPAPADAASARALGAALAAAGAARRARSLLAAAARRWPAAPGPARLLGELVGGGAGRRWLARAAAGGPEPDADRLAARLLLGRAAAAAAEGGRLARRAAVQEDYDHLLNPLALTLARRASAGLAGRLGRAPGAWGALFAVSLGSMGGEPSRMAEAGARLRALAGREPWMRYLCGHLELQTTGDVALADRDFRAAAAAAPGMWKAHAYVAEMALCLGRPGEADRRMERLCAALDGAARADAAAWWGAMLLWQGRAVQAERILAGAVDGGAQFGRAWLGAARVLAGRPAEGLADLDAALAGRAPEEEALVWRAEAHRLLGRPARARADLAAALRANPSSDWARLSLARLDPRRGLEGVRPGLLEALGLSGAPAGRAALEEAFRRARGLRRSAAYLDRLFRPS